VEVTDTLFDGWMDDLRAFERRVTEELRSALLVRPKVKLVEPGSLERSEGKARRVIDNRPS
jgi:phenylacetate-CoA ligase